MPEKSTNTTAHSLSKNKPADAPHLDAQMFSEKITKEKAAILGIEGFLLKPVIKADLAAKVRSVLDNQYQGRRT